MIAAVDRWLESLDQSHKDHEHHVLEALWVHQHHNVVDAVAFGARASARPISAPAPRPPACSATGAIAFGTHSTCSSKLAADEHARVRLEAVRAASFYDVPEAVEIIVIADEHPRDTYLDFVRDETMKTLDPIWKKALGEGRQIAFTTEPGARFLLRSMSNERLLKMDEESHGLP